MQEYNDQLDKTREIPDVSSKNEDPTVHKDQQSMFDTGDVFSESMVVEKENVEIDSAENGGDTAVFDFPAEKKENEAISHEELNAKELQGTAKDYFKATHTESIEDKINELRILADEGFDTDKTTETEVASVNEVFDEEDEKEKKKELKKAQKEKKKKRKGHISNDDIELLMNGDALREVAEVFAKTSENLPVVESETDSESEDDVSDSYGDTTDFDKPEFDKPEFDKPEFDKTDFDKTGEAFLRPIGTVDNEYKSFEDVFEDDEPEDEYVNRNEEAGILERLRKKAIYSMFSIVLTLVVAALCFYFELAAGTEMPHPHVFEPGRYSVVYAMSMLQLMFVGVIFNLEGVKRAFLALRPKKTSAEGFCAATLVVCTVHSVVSCFVAGNKTELISLCTVGCLALLFLSISSFIKAQTTLSAFCVAASKHPKYSLAKIGEGSTEEKNFEKYLENSTLFVSEKSDFVKGFFRKIAVSPAVSKGTVTRIIITISVAVAVGIVCGFILGIYSGICAFSAMCLVSFPVNALVSTALPFFMASSRAKKTQTAYIGEAACDAYENMGVISFEDTEVFPPRSVKVSSIRTYENNRIDKVILYMAKIFDKVPGPLSYVFANSVQNIDEADSQAKITEHFSNGMCAKIDGKEILVGTGDFLRLYDIETPLDNIDDSFTRTMGSIMFMAVDGTLAAKFYIKYAINRNFESLLHAFYEAGICVGIRTYDPCVNDELVCGNLKGSNYPISVINIHPEESGAPGVSEETESSIVSVSSLHNFLKGFIRLDNLRNVYRTNTFIGLLCTVVGMGLTAFLSITGAGAGAAFLAVFQLLWCIPTVLLSVLSK